MDSPLGQSLFQNSSLFSLNTTEIEGPAHSGLTFDPMAWANRTVGSSSNPNYIWTFSNNTSQLENNSTNSNGLYGGIPGSPVEGTQNSSRAVQAVWWINITAGNAFGSTLAELQDLLEGLMLSASPDTGTSSNGTIAWDAANSILGGIASRLPSLDLPQGVLNTLANSSLNNNGSYKPPVYNATAAKEGTFTWQDFAAEVWNTVTGVVSWVVDGVSSLVSVTWNWRNAAAAFVGGAIQGGLTAASHGLAKLKSQTAAAFHQLEKVLDWALHELVVHVFGPLIANLTGAYANSYTSALGADLSSKNGAQFWKDYSGPTFWAS